MSSIRLGYVKYLNTLPLVEGLAACRDLSLHAAVPSHIIDMLSRDEIDIGLASLIDAVRSPHPIALLPVGMIGCDGPTLTVRLFSARPLSEVTRVYADTDSHTSVALMQIVLHKLYARRVEVIAFDAREHVVAEPSSSTPALAADGWPETLLLIGDKVVSDSPPPERYPHQLDLGEAWKSLTGLPFVYAVWMCKAERADEPGVRLAASLLERQRLHNRTRLDWIVSKHAADRAWPDADARHYVGDLLRYDVADREREAAEQFIEAAASLGLAPSRLLTWSEPQTNLMPSA